VKSWEYFGKIYDTRGFADRAAGTVDELMSAGIRGPIPNANGRLADVGRLRAAFLKWEPDAEGEPEPQPQPVPTTKPPPRIELIEAPGPVGEARLVARRIRRLMAEGVSPNAIVVTARDIEASADVLAEVFDEYTIPAMGFPSPPLARAPAVAFLLRAWRVPAGGFAFADVAAVLRSTFFRPPGVEPERPAKAEALLRKVGGPDGKEAFLRAVERWADEPDEPLDDERPEADVRQRTHALARTCRAFVESFFALWDEIPTRAKPAAWVACLRRFAQDCGVEPTAHPDDTAALDALWSGLAVWLELSPATKAVSARDFAADLAIVTAAAPAPVPPPPEPAVRVLASEDARDATCDYLFLTGLGEGSFPNLAPPDSLLTDADRIELRTGGHALPDPAARRGIEQTLFDALVARPRTLLVLSYPAVDAKGQEQLPSSFLADWRERNEVADVTMRKMLIQGYAAEELYSEAERRVRFANNFATGTNGTHGVAAPTVIENLKRAKQLAAARFDDKSFNRFDGGLSPQFLTANRDLIGPGVFDPGHVFSPTALEAYVACPFKFWLGHVLGVEPLDDPPDAVEHTRRGRAIHRALKAFHAAGPDCDDAVAAGVRAAFDKAVEDYIRRTGGAVAALWALDAVRLRRTAGRYGGQWQAFRAKESKSGPTPVPKHFESEFGRKPLEITVDGIHVRIGGTIDRIDVATLPDGLGFWVIDYKSGRATSYSGAAVARLERLQLPLYALAVERVLFKGQRARPLGLAYWLVTDTGPKSVLKKVDWTKFRDQLERWVTAVVAQLRSGAFPLAPRSKDCTATCRHGPVCRIAQHRNSAKRFDLPLPTISSEGDAE
jgi:ATP-dependent helicase/DNAse subunit B